MTALRGFILTTVWIAQSISTRALLQLGERRGYAPEETHDAIFEAEDAGLIYRDYGDGVNDRIIPTSKWHSVTVDGRPKQQEEEV